MPASGISSELRAHQMAPAEVVAHIDLMVDKWHHPHTSPRTTQVFQLARYHVALIAMKLQPFVWTLTHRRRWQISTEVETIAHLEPQQDGKSSDCT